MNTLIFYRYVLKEHIGPFIFALSIIIFLFLINFTLREAGNLFGRGLSVFLILKVFYYHMAPILAMAIPMSVLIATLMAFIRMASDSEITILRSSGINLTTILTPLFFASIIVFIAMFYFMNTILPQYNIENSKLFREISRLKPTAKIHPLTFTELKHVKLYVESIDDNFNEDVEEKVMRLGEEYRDFPVDHLFDVIIYDMKDPKKSVTIFAKEAFVLLNVRKKVYEFILFDGKSQEIEIEELSEYKSTKFSKSTFYIAANEFIEQETTTETNWKSSRQKTADELEQDVIKEYGKLSKRKHNLLKNFSDNKILLEGRNDVNAKKASADIKRSVIIPENDIEIKEDTTDDTLSVEVFETKLYSQFVKIIKEQENSTKSTLRQKKHSYDDIYNWDGEWHKKYSIPFASIIFIFIGAPLGMLTRKGEAGSAVTICLLVFLVNHTCLILGERLSEDQKISPILGLWSGHIINSVFATILLIKLQKEKTIEISIKPLLRIFGRKK